MTDDIEELHRMHNTVTEKIRYFSTVEGRKSTVKSLERTLQKIDDKIKEIESNK